MSGLLALISWVIGIIILISGSITNHAGELSLWITIAMLFAYPAGFGARCGFEKLHDRHSS